MCAATHKLLAKVWEVITILMSNCNYELFSLYTYVSHNIKPLRIPGVVSPLLILADKISAKVVINTGRSITTKTSKQSQKNQVSQSSLIQ